MITALAMAVAAWRVVELGGRRRALNPRASAAPPASPPPRERWGPVRSFALPSHAAARQVLDDVHGADGAELSHFPKPGAHAGIEPRRAGDHSWHEIGRASCRERV